MLVRTWNLFHGNSVPAGRMRLSRADGPPRGCRPSRRASPGGRSCRSGRSTSSRPGRRCRRSRRLAHRDTAWGHPSAGMITRLNPGLLRSAVSGRGTRSCSIEELEPFDYHALVLNPLDFRDERHHVGLGGTARLGEGAAGSCKPFAGQDFRTTGGCSSANLHATSYSASRCSATLELRRARGLLPRAHAAR